MGEQRYFGLDLIVTSSEAIEKIHQRMQAAQSRQKSYADKRRRPLEFQVDDKVFLKAAPIKGLMRFGKKGKLSPRFIGPFEILKHARMFPTILSSHHHYQEYTMPFIYPC